MQYWPSKIGRNSVTIDELKDLMAQFDKSNLREFSFKNKDEEISFSKNDYQKIENHSPQAVVSEVENKEIVVETKQEEKVAEGQLVESPLVGVAYLSSSPGAAQFVSVGDQVKKGQTLLIIEAMKVMNELPAPCDGIVTEILVSNEEVVEFGKGLVRIK
ncbi:acetyl-CoA carboxylase biotin carboxyl carrier protein [Streptococcus iniae]|nr:acetyl-CoA carboxylase biotin carboxyl carrier protein subunit [Streptococcus iniae]ELY5747752.1 acetyl-CoA carboxylase biotin carboxyl carrier protein [Streptococcus iniae]ELY5749119.1 acetyl-CoA carboxylase biotin carboxyl carrier protein [Streptococcus iniae]ELY5751065.1 acetyl-CoA carboxylase biotin carboxyl carrier protein [Streptococcus iniae]MCA1358007.1 acetyl-CoA carboxylase biotin carboxyl carrier protein subunit [Streptococcus iniae]MCM0722626.1 acetyl-CoA carboxylase biotin carb